MLKVAEKYGAGRVTVSGGKKRYGVCHSLWWRQEKTTKQSKYQSVRDALFFVVLTMKIKRNWKKKY
jgi:hypothetical protein